MLQAQRLLHVELEDIEDEQNKKTAAVAPRASIGGRASGTLQKSGDKRNSGAAAARGSKYAGMKKAGMRRKSVRKSMNKSEPKQREQVVELADEDAAPGVPMAPHSVLTLHLHRSIPDSGTMKARDKVIAFFREKVGA